MGRRRVAGGEVNIYMVCTIHVINIIIVVVEVVMVVEVISHLTAPAKWATVKAANLDGRYVAIGGGQYIYMAVLYIVYIIVVVAVVVVVVVVAVAVVVVVIGLTRR